MAHKRAKGEPWDGRHDFTAAKFTAPRSAHSLLWWDQEFFTDANGRGMFSRSVNADPASPPRNWGTHRRFSSARAFRDAVAKTLSYY